MTVVHLEHRSLVLDAVEKIIALQYVCLVAITLLYYDHILTLRDEIKHIWRRKLSPISIVFLLNRYTSFFGYMPIIFFFFNSPRNDHNCRLFAHFPGALNCISQILIGAILVIRAYALYYRQIWVLILTCALGASTVATALWALAVIKDINLPFGSNYVFRICFTSGTKSTLSFKVSWSVSMVYETTLSILSISRTYTMYKNHRSGALQSDMLTLFLRDGSLYFAVMAAANLINLLLFVYSKNTFVEQSTGNNSVLTHIISVIAASRLVLNIRDLGDSQTSTTSPQLTTGIPRSLTWNVRQQGPTIQSAESSNVTTGTDISFDTDISYGQQLDIESLSPKHA
ncbi:hypothetical protein BD410DRAFT_787419 [Rickenella mellea]|uniref:DUF6533 domain-containing protein n=1 Tax=Rickenella mellea TaxID=50990 RepID=A0A4Y7Q8E5_9AGAM|nr:hypothetical protein BD410DRAFT_787419 [Rickenella mellea]